MSLAARRAAAAYLQSKYEVSERRACRVLSLSRSTKRRQPGEEDKELITRIYTLSYQFPRYGYRKIWKLLTNEGRRVSRERVRQIRRREGLQVSRKQKKQRRTGQSTGVPCQAEHPGHVWSYDFVQDRTADGKSLRCLTVIDEFTREGLAIEVARSLTSGDAKRVLDRLFEIYGRPEYIRSDNGPEFVANALTEWLRDDVDVGTIYIEPGSPWQNGYNESFNGVFRDNCLDRWWFCSLREAREEIASWLEEYNTIRPHGAIGLETPAAYSEQLRRALKKAA